VDPIRDALRVSWVCIAWSVASGLASLIVGIITGALSLGGLGASVLVDVGSSGVLVWRFRHERDLGNFPEAAERRAQIVAATGLVIIGVLLLATASEHLVAGVHPETPAVALVLAAANLVVLPVLARWKYRVADAVGSAALRTDAHITMVGTATSALTVVGLAVDRAFGWWWADAVAAMLIGVIAGWQGIRSLAAAR